MTFAAETPIGPRRPVRSALVRALRWLIDRLGGESDDALRARVMALYGRSLFMGSRESFERAISNAAPVGMALEFIWDSPVCRLDATRLTVVMR